MLTGADLVLYQADEPVGLVNEQYVYVVALGSDLDVVKLPAVDVEGCNVGDSPLARLGRRFREESAEKVVAQSVGAARVEEPECWSSRRSILRTSKRLNSARRSSKRSKSRSKTRACSNSWGDAESGRSLFTPLSVVVVEVGSRSPRSGGAGGCL